MLEEIIFAFGIIFVPIELQKAHTQNDIAVMKAYGFNIKEMTEADCVTELMKMYQKMISL